VKIKDISFIVISLNEEFAINKCLSSICSMDLENCEIICVDSSSTDNTVSVMKNYKKKFENFKIFVIKGYANAAIARNVGICNATKKYIYFVDGDVELYENFIIEACKKNEKEFDAITGDLAEYCYAPDYNRVVTKTKSRFNIKKEVVIYVSGGCFLVKRDTVKKIGLFDERFERSEDNEFTLRLTKWYKMIAIPQFMGIHHTVPYYNKQRMKTSLYRNYPVYIGMVIRRNIANYKGLSAYFLKVSGIVLGVFLLIVFALALFLVPFPFNFLTILVLFIGDLFYGLLQAKDIVYRMSLHYMCPFYLLIGLFFDIDPRKEYSVIEIE